MVPLKFSFFFFFGGTFCLFFSRMFIIEVFFRQLLLKLCQVILTFLSLDSVIIVIFYLSVLDLPGSWYDDWFSVAPWRFWVSLFWDSRSVVTGMPDKPSAYHSNRSGAMLWLPSHVLTVYCLRWNSLTSFRDEKRVLLFPTILIFKILTPFYFHISCPFFYYNFIAFWHSVRIFYRLYKNKTCLVQKRI